jgi:NADH-ubiquinone oxidoreductase chain 2
MAYSSITHIGWILIIITRKNLLLLYLIIYSLIILSITINLKEIIIFNIITLYKKHISKIFTIRILSLGGIPPFLGFIPKLIAINHIAKNNLLILPALIAGALINLSYYISILIKSTLINSWSNNLITKINPKNQSLISLSLILTFTIIII